MSRWPWLRICVGAALVAATTGAAVAVETSCIGVQMVSADQRFASLPESEREKLAPVINQIHAWAKQVEDGASASEASFNAAYNPAKEAYLQTHPGETDAQVWQGLLRALRNGDPMDSALADHFEAQAKIHEIEVKMATAAARMPSATDQRQLKQIDGALIANPGNADRSTIAALHSSRAYGQLVSALVVAEAAEGGSDIPAGALVGRRFDTRVADPAVEAAVAATDAIVAINGDRLGSNLLRGHLEDTLRIDPQARQEMVRGGGRAAATVSRQFGTELIRTTTRDRAIKKMANLGREALAPPRPGESAQAKDRRIATETKRTVEKVRTLRIRLLPPDPSPAVPQ